MTAVFVSALGDDIAAFLKFKRAVGHAYVRGEYMLKAFDRFAAAAPRRGGKRAWLRDIMRAWLSRPAESERKPILSRADVLRVLRGAAALGRPPFRAKAYRAFLLVLYCTGLRFGEACRLRIRDVDLDRRVVFVAMSKGRSRWVPFHATLTPELRRYLRARRAYARTRPDDRFFVGQAGVQLHTKTASETVRGLLCAAGLKPPKGRVGARPYDFRHAFAVHRLERWYRAGVDLQSRLPWLSAYMGHDNILGTEKYLHATPWLLDVAARRLRRRLARRASA